MYWRGNEATVCRLHRTPSDWDYEPLSLTETREFIEMLQTEGLAKVSPCEPCEMGYDGAAPRGSADLRRGAADRMNETST